jgi:hypothetical protein
MTVQYQKFNARLIFCRPKKLLRLYVYPSPPAEGYFRARLSNIIMPSESTVNPTVKMTAFVASVVMEEMYIGYKM